MSPPLLTSTGSSSDHQVFLSSQVTGSRPFAPFSCPSPGRRGRTGSAQFDRVRLPKFQAQLAPDCKAPTQVGLGTKVFDVGV